MGRRSVGRVELRRARDAGGGGRERRIPRSYQSRYGIGRGSSGSELIYAPAAAAADVRASTSAPPPLARPPPTRHSTNTTQADK